MAAFPRTVPPASVTYPQVIGSLISVGQSGAVQTRSEPAQGRAWKETWGAISAGNEAVQELRATIENLYNTGATCTITHYLLPGSGIAKNGAGGGTPLVDGGSQYGSTLDTKNWTSGVAVRMKAGDCFTIAGLDVLFKAVTDVSSDGSGDATITIQPPIMSGAGSTPADDAALTLSSATMTAVVEDYSAASAGPDEFIGGLTVTFREAP